MRWVLCEAAQTAKRHPDVAATDTAMARRRGKEIATTAVAGTLLARASHLLCESDAAGRRPRSKDSTHTTTSQTTTTMTTERRPPARCVSGTRR